MLHKLRKSDFGKKRPRTVKRNDGRAQKPEQQCCKLQLVNIHHVLCFASHVVVSRYPVQQLANHKLGGDDGDVMIIMMMTMVMVKDGHDDGDNYDDGDYDGEDGDDDVEDDDDDDDDGVEDDDVEDVCRACGAQQSGLADKTFCYR
ncbi:hypothetical protein RRG08_030415 [Elysia crispata]|uniref:Uncharacterized protein n=1 Tax=Elysia crispata TaxID=231223 RepID=A0AAE0YHM7_9GAST|nr:hypothetical protein RRG08_030415 [Elysia crispata]